jgi:hypothetical protein
VGEELAEQPEPEELRAEDDQQDRQQQQRPGPI